MVTLKDVANRAGVSIRTVSNVVNEWPHVRPALRERVQQAIDEMGYRPNVAARHLRGGRSGVAALVVPEIDTPYFAELARCFGKEFSKRGLSLAIEQTDGEIEREREVIGTGGRPLLFDGIVFSAISMSSAEFLRRGQQAPLVLIGEQLGGECDHVLIDNIAAAQRATQHLLELGRRRIAIIGRQPGAGINTSELRVEGYKAALRAASVPILDQLMPPTPEFSRTGGVAVATDLFALAEPPDALFCLSDLLALGAMRVALRNGLRVPDDVAVVGFDDTEEGRFSLPSLTSVAPDKPAIAAAAVELLMRRIDGDTSKPQVIEAGFDLAIRGSTVGEDAIAPVVASPVPAGR